LDCIEHELYNEVEGRTQPHKIGELVTSTILKSCLAIRKLQW